MAGIGEAASIIGVLQFGFSLAKTLTEYIGEYKAAEKNITALANNIEVTFRQVDELQDLLKANQTTQGFSEATRINAVTCCLKAEKLGEELWQMLGKSDVARPIGRDIERKDIDLSLFHKALWPRFKPRVEEAERKFLLLKLDITIVLVSYHGKNSLPETPQGLETLENLKKSRKLAVRELRAARKKRKGVRSRHAHFDSGIPSPPVRQTSGDSYKSDEYHAYVPRRAYHQGLYRSRDVDDASITSSMYNDIEESVLRFQEQAEARRKATEEERKEREKKARYEFEKQLVEKVENSRAHAEQARNRLSELFDVPSNAPAINAYIAELQAQDLGGDEVASTIYTQLNGLLVSDGRDTATESGVRRGKMARGSSLWSSFAKRWARSTNTITSSTYDSLPMFQPNEFPGRQNFVGLVLSANHNGNAVHRIGISRAWLQHALAMEAKEILKKGGPTRTAETYSRISVDAASLLTETLLQYGYTDANRQIVYARELSKQSSRTRQIIQMAVFGPDMQRLHHRSMLLVYLIHGKENTADTPASNQAVRGTMLPQNTTIEPLPSGATMRPVSPPEANLSPAELVRERRKSRKSEAYGGYDSYAPYPNWSPAAPVQLADTAVRPSPSVYSHRDRPSRRGSYDRTEVDRDADFALYRDIEDYYPGRHYEPRSPTLQDRIGRLDGYLRPGHYYPRPYGPSPSATRSPPVINIYNDQSYDERTQARHSARPAPSPPSVNVYNDQASRERTFVAPSSLHRSRSPQAYATDTQTVRSEISRREQSQNLDYSVPRSRSRTNYRRWQNEKPSFPAKYDDVEPDRIESRHRTRRHEKRPAPARHDQIGRPGLDSVAKDYMFHVAAADSHESSDDSDAEDSDADLSDTSIVSSRDNSWTELKNEAASREKSALGTSHRCPTVSTSFTDDGVQLAGSPDSMSDAEGANRNRHDRQRNGTDHESQSPDDIWGSFVTNKNKKKKKGAWEVLEEENEEKGESREEKEEPEAPIATATTTVTGNDASNSALVGNKDTDIGYEKERALGTESPRSGSLQVGGV